jgi:hypothetical protein
MPMMAMIVSKAAILRLAREAERDRDDRCLIARIVGCRRHLRRSNPGSFAMFAAIRPRLIACQQLG